MFVTSVKWLNYCPSYNWIKILVILDAFWFLTNFFVVVIVDIFVFEVTHFITSTKNGRKWPSHFHLPQKWVIDLLFKIMESANTCQILRTPLPAPLLCRHHKCMFLFWFFKVWSVTCLNANGILDFVKIQSSYLLSSYQINQKIGNI